MSEFKFGDAPLRLGFDARRLTPRQDTIARGLGSKIMQYLGGDLSSFVQSNASDEKSVREMILLHPYALMYAMQTAAEIADKVPREGLEQAARGIWKRDDE